MPHDKPPEPWHSFLADLDCALDRPVELHCLGAFAMAMLYDLPRPTVDIDYLTVIPRQDTTVLNTLAGEGSVLHKRYRVYMQHVGIVSVPESYEDRLLQIFASRKITIWGLEAHDLALSKLERNSRRDREDIR